MVTKNRKKPKAAPKLKKVAKSPAKLKAAKSLPNKTAHLKKAAPKKK